MGPAVMSHILVVEDEILAATQMATILRRWGYRVTTRHTVNDAIGAHSEDPTDLIITDIRMPQRNGIHLLQEIKAGNPKFPIIVVTGQIDFYGPSELARFLGSSRDRETDQPEEPAHRHRSIDGRTGLI